MTAAGNVVKCKACGQANRLPAVGEGQSAICGRCKSPLTESGASRHPVVVTDASFEEFIKSTKPVLVDFWAAWCGPCRAIAPVIEALAAERDDVLFAKLNVDENRVTPPRYRISGIPTLILFQGGRELTRIVGAVGKSQIEQALAQNLSRAS